MRCTAKKEAQAELLYPRTSQKQAEEVGLGTRSLHRGALEAFSRALSE